MLTKIDMLQDIAAALEGKDVYMCIPIRSDTTLEQLRGAEIFAVEAEEKADVPEEPKPKPKKEPKVDVGKINALHQAGWPIREIAKEMGVSDPTVRKYIQLTEVQDE